MNEMSILVDLRRLMLDFDSIAPIFNGGSQAFFQLFEESWAVCAPLAVRKTDA